ncbi:MAG: protein kinase [Planctomycetota bacterium]
MTHDDANSGERPEADDLEIGRLVEEYLRRASARETVDLDQFLEGAPERIRIAVRDEISILREIDGLVGDEERAAPKRLGEFELRREIGRGGMGIVYEAEQEALGRRVALKVLPLVGALDSRQLERFRNEARAAARLHHANIVPVYAVGNERGTYYYAMQFIEGRDLQELLRDLRREARGEIASPSAITSEVSSTERRSLSFFRAVVRIVLQAAEALAYAHEHGIVHRDVKPANLILEENGQLWVTDFGLAQLGKDCGVTLTGEVVGTLRYMSPEQARGDRASVNARADVYSLGITLYELATLESPFAGENRADLLRKILREEPRRPRAVEPTVPVDLETMILRSIEKDPSDRYASMKEFASDLRAFLEDRPICARPVSFRERSWRWCRRNPLVTTLTFLTSISLVALALGALVFSEIRTSQRDARRAEARTKLYADLIRARSERESGLPGRTVQSKRLLRAASLQLKTLKLERSERDEVTQRLRNEIIATGASWDATLEYSETSVPGARPTLSRSSRHFARVDAEQRVLVSRLDGSRTWTIPAPPGTSTSHLAFSSSARRLIVSRLIGQSKRLEVWDWRAPKKIFSHMGLRGQSFSAITRDDRHLWSMRLHPTRALVRFDLESGEESTRSLPTDVVRIALSPDDRKLAMVAQSQVYVLDLESDERPPWKIRLTPYQAVLFAAWSDDSNLLACGGGGDLGTVNVYEVHHRRLVSSRTNHQQTVSQGAFGARNKILATSSWDRTLHLVDPFSGIEHLRLGSTASYCTLGFSADGTIFGPLRSGKKLELWSLRPPTLWRDLQSTEDLGTSVLLDVSIDGTWAVEARTRGVQLWDLRSERSLGFLPIGRVSGVRIHPSTGDLWTSYSRVLRWPVNRVAGTLYLGPPEPVETEGAPTWALHFDPSGRYLALCGLARMTHVVDLEEREVRYRGAPSIRAIPTKDGSVFCVTDQTTGELRQIDCASGRIRRLNKNDATWPTLAMSSDGRWLALADHDALVFDRHGNLSEPERLETHSNGTLAAVSQDGKLLAYVDSGRRLELVSLPTRARIATLPPVDTAHARGIEFAPDGSKLLVSMSNRALRVWDLANINSVLAEYGVNWSTPPSNESESSTQSPLRLDVLYGFSPETRRHDEANEATRKKIERFLDVQPEEPSLHRCLAGWYAARGEIESAIRALDAASDHGLRTTLLESDRSRLFERRGETGKALRAWKNAIDAKTAPPTEADFARWETLALAAKDDAEAARCIERSIDVYGNSPARLKKTFEYSIRLSPRFATFRSVDVALLQGIDEARASRLLENFERAAKRGDQPVLDYLRGHREFIGQRYAQAISVFENVLASSPNANEPLKALLDSFAANKQWQAVRDRARSEIVRREVAPKFVWTRFLENSLHVDGTLRISCGGQPHHTPHGTIWNGDRFSVSGQAAIGDRVLDFPQTNDDDVYLDARFAPKSKKPVPLYRIPLPGGDYRVKLRFLRPSLDRDPESETRAHHFDVYLEGERVFANYSPTTEIPETRYATTSVTDGHLDVAFAAETGTPWVNGIEIVRIEAE